MYGTIGLWFIVTFLIIGEPIMGVLAYRRLKAGTMTRMRMYRMTLLQEWFLVGLTMAIFLADHVPLRNIGLGTSHYSVLSGAFGGLAAGVIFGVLVTMVLSILSGRRRTRTISMGRPIKIGNFDFLLPSNRAEHWTFAWVAITAGICEEMLFRVLVIYVLQHQFPSLSWGMIVAITALIFGMAHLYQGWIGIVGTGLLGAVLAIIYLTTGTILLPILIHMLSNIRGLVLTNGRSYRDVEM